MTSEHFLPKKQLLKIIFRAASIVRTREPRLRTICDTAWLEQLKFLPIRTLLRKFKYIIGNSSLRTLYELHKKNLFANSSDEVKQFVALAVKSRNLGVSSYAATILQG